MHKKWKWYKMVIKSTENKQNLVQRMRRRKTWGQSMMIMMTHTHTTCE